MTQVGTLSTWRAIVQVSTRHRMPVVNSSYQLILHASPLHEAIALNRARQDRKDLIQRNSAVLHSFIMLEQRVRRK